MRNPLRTGNLPKVTTNLNLLKNENLSVLAGTQTNGKITVAGYSETSVHKFKGEDEFISCVGTECMQPRQTFSG